MSEMKYREVKLKMQRRDDVIFAEIEVIPTNSDQARLMMQRIPIESMDAQDLSYSDAMAKSALKLHAFLVNECRENK